MMVLVLPIITIQLVPRPYNLAGAAAVALLAAISLLWTGFVLWRVLRLSRASGVKGDREFDRSTRPMLGPEYRDAESATKARRRRR